MLTRSRERVCGLGRLALAISILTWPWFTGYVFGQESADRWVDTFSQAVRRLDVTVERSLSRDSRLHRPADRVLERAAAVIDARRPPSDRELQRVHDAAAVFKSDLLDSAARAHPERLGQLEQLVGLTEALRGHAVSGIHADAMSLEDVEGEIILSAEDTAEALNSALEELSDDETATAGHQLEQVAERVRTLRDNVKALAEPETENAAELGTSAANQALVIRGELLVLALSGSELPVGTLQAARRAALHLEGELSDYALMAAHREQLAAPSRMGRLGALTETAMEDMHTLLNATPDQQRDAVQAMVADAHRVRSDIGNLTRDPVYAPRQRLDDIYGRITRVIEQTDAIAGQTSDRTSGLLMIVQADLAALRDLAILAATEHLKLYDVSVQRLVPQMVNVDLSAEEQLQVKLNFQDGRVALARVAPRGTAARAGLRTGDILLTANGRQLQTDVDLATALEAAARAQRSLRLELVRNGNRLSRQVSLGSTPRHANRSSGADGNR